MYQVCKCIHIVYEGGICSNMIHNMLYVTSGKPPFFPRTLFIVTLKQSFLTLSSRSTSIVQVLEFVKHLRPIHFCMSACYLSFKLSVMWRCFKLCIIVYNTKFLSHSHCSRAELSLFVCTQTIAFRLK